MGTSVQQLVVSISRQKISSDGHPIGMPPFQISATGRLSLPYSVVPYNIMKVNSAALQSLGANHFVNNTNLHLYHI